MQTRAVFGKRPSVVLAPSSAPRAWKTAPVDFRAPVTEASIARLASDTTAAMAGAADEIVWVISSPGGELPPALECCHTLAAAPLKLTTFGVGCVASAATYLMLAGAQRIAHPDGPINSSPAPCRRSRPPPRLPTPRRFPPPAALADARSPSPAPSLERFDQRLERRDDQRAEGRSGPGRPFGGHARYLDGQLQL